MLRATDIRIGNWVRTKQTRQEFIVSGISKESIGIIESQWTGITITEEWLDKTSLVKRQTSSPIIRRYYGHERDGRFIVSHNEKIGGFWVDWEHSSYGDQVTLRRFEYVHQLQNLYHSLTGKELQINES